jgi:hypothetical protein
VASELNRTTPSILGTVYLTKDTLVSGALHEVVWRTDDWSPIGRSVRRCIGGTETQEIDRGGDDGTLNWPIELEIPYCSDVLYAALRAQRDTLATLYTATLHLEATDEDGIARSYTFAGLRWVDLTHRDYAARTYEGVLATLTSEE